LEPLWMTFLTPQSKMAQNNRRRRELENVARRLMAANAQPINRPVNGPLPEVPSNGVARLSAFMNPIASSTPRSASSGTNKKGGKTRRTRRGSKKSRRVNRK
jgi:hypothetical protein